MRFNMLGAFVRNSPFGTEIAFSKGLKRLGHDVLELEPGHHAPEILEDDLALSADATIVFKWIDGKWAENLSKITHPKIIYQPDDLRFPHIKKMMIEMKDLFDYAFTFDSDGEKLALQYGYKKARRLLLTADNTLYRHIPDTPKIFDMCFVGSLTSGGNHRSRMKMIQILRDAFPDKSFAVGSDVYDMQKLVGAYNSSKIILNHATDVGQPFGHGFGYQCRHFEAGFTRSCVLSNVVDNDQTLKNFDTFSNAEELVERVHYLLGDPERREDLAAGLYDELNSAHLPEHRGQEIVDFVKGL